MPVQPAALELLADLSKVLASWGRWYVFGAQAVIAYGVPRLSADVDVTLRANLSLRDVRRGGVVKSESEELVGQISLVELPSVRRDLLVQLVLASAQSQPAYSFP